MAIPKVFISSTCFDLSEIREQLSKFVASFGFDPILSDHGDVFYHPDLHTHEACVHEVSNCQLFILIIGGRYGGSYTIDKTKSITNAEYEAAFNHGIPVFTYIKKDVLSDHHIYTTNLNNEISSQITYPSIAKQKDSLSIFSFINQVRRQNKNNSYEGFDNFGHIENHLRKQWAGMFFDFLRTKEIKSQINATNHLLTNLKRSNSKLEDLVKQLYLNPEEKTEEKLKSMEKIEISYNLKDFFEIFESELSTYLKLTPTKLKNELNKSDNSIEKLAKKLAKISPTDKNWFQYVNELKIFPISLYEKVMTNEDEKTTAFDFINLSIKITKTPILNNLFNENIRKTSTENRVSFYKNYLQNFILKYF